MFLIKRESQLNHYVLILCLQFVGVLDLKIIPKELFLISLSKQKNDLASSISKGIIFDTNQDVEFELALDNASEYKKYKLSKNGLVEIK